MKILGFFEVRRLKAAVAAVSSSLWTNTTRIFESFAGAWQRGFIVDPTEEITAFSGVFSCLSLISKDIGKLGRPCLKKFNKTDQIWEQHDNTAYSPLLRRPNRYQTWNQFLAYWILSKFIFGNAYILKEREQNNRKIVRALYILDPRRVIPLIAPDGEIYYQIGGDWLAGIQNGLPYCPSAEIIHDRHTCLFHPLVGVGPIYAAAVSATQGRRIQKNSALFFQNMSRPSGQLTAPGTINETTAKRLKETFEAEFAGQNVGRLLVAGDGLKFEPFTIPAEQAQMIEQLKWTVEDVARAFQMPLYKIGAGTMPAMANVGALNLEYYEQTLQPHIEDIETLLDLGCELSDDLGMELDLDTLLRMDPKTRAETDEIRVRSATLSPNESRRAWNLPPKTGGSALYLQQQNYSLEALAKRDASDDPFGTKQPAAAPGAPAAANDDQLPDDAAAKALDAVDALLIKEAA